MSSLYIITGPAGVGKSTISRRIAESKNKSALIEGDEIYHQVVGGYGQNSIYLTIFLNISLTDSGYLSDLKYLIIF